MTNENWNELKPGPRKVQLVLLVCLFLVWVAQIVEAYIDTGSLDGGLVIGAILAVILIVMEIRYKPPEPWVKPSDQEE